MRHKIPAVFLALALGGCTPTAPPKPPLPPAPAAVRGGSNLLSFTTGATSGIVAQFDANRATIAAQLQQMYANGQRTITLPLLFFHGASDGAALDSAAGTSQNLVDLLALIKATGFERIDVRMLPEWTADPENWVSPGAWDSPDYGTCTTNAATGSIAGSWYRENWEFLVSTRALVIGSGIPYVLDLMGEGIDPRFEDYVRRLWRDYVAQFGTSDTLGFSFVPTVANAKLIPTIYGAHLPGAMAIDVYDNSTYGFQCNLSLAGDCVRATYIGISAALDAAGYSGPLIVSETLANDAPSAAALVVGRQATGRPILWVTQWPLARGFSPGATQNVLPLDFSAYIQQGF
jgi:hypothetical protein